MKSINNTYSFLLQENKEDCGRVCILMILNYYQCKEVDYSIIPKNKLSIFQIVDFLNFFNVNSLAIELDDINQIHKINYPFIAFLNNKHYVVVFKSNRNNILIADPGRGRVVLKKESFKNFFFNNVEKKGYAITTYNI